MTLRPERQDPVLLNGAASRFARAFTSTTTRSREDGSPGGRPWAWLAGAAVLTGCVVLSLFVYSMFPSDSPATVAKTTATAAVGTGPSGPAHSAPSPSAVPGNGGGGAARPGAPGTAGAAGTDVTSGDRNSPATDRTPTTPSRPTRQSTSSGSDSTTGGSSGASGSAGSSNASGTSGTSGTSGESKSVTYPGVRVYSHADGRCVTASGSRTGAARDGTRLEMRDCVGGSWQKIDFRSDGTARMFGLCMDIAGASEANGTPVQLARCNGGWAQKFKVNQAHDLVNTVIGKCVDVKDKLQANGTPLQLWSCVGADNQKWSTA
ncbi:RICIN domain-containing protein [Streptomyces sp. NPDC023723]|uniref:RICIN domain-containing protein n=1 Tax=Streptomyces sp. NPDC023723 TaxID=3154323 RepID=UPI0034093BA9